MKKIVRETRVKEGKLVCWKEGRKECEGKEGTCGVSGRVR